MPILLQDKTDEELHINLASPPKSMGTDAPRMWPAPMDIFVPVINLHRSYNNTRLLEHW